MMTPASTPCLRWREVDVETGVWSTLLPAPADNRGFIEAGIYAFEKPGRNWSFLIDDEPLQTDPDDDSCWRWEPRFFAGEVTADSSALEDSHKNHSGRGL